MGILGWCVGGGAGGNAPHKYFILPKNSVLFCKAGGRSINILIILCTSVT